jgi:hypothetical protein
MASDEWRPNGLAFSCRERIRKALQNRRISRAKRSAAMPGWAEAGRDMSVFRLSYKCRINKRILPPARLYRGQARIHGPYERLRFTSALPSAAGAIFMIRLYSGTASVWLKIHTVSASCPVSCQCVWYSLSV